MRVHLRIQGPLGNRPLQIIDQATATEHFRFNDDLAALGRWPHGSPRSLAPAPDRERPRHRTVSGPGTRPTPAPVPCAAAPAASTRHRAGRQRPAGGNGARQVP